MYGSIKAPVADKLKPDDPSSNRKPEVPLFLLKATPFSYPRRVDKAGITRVTADLHVACAGCEIHRSAKTYKYPTIMSAQLVRRFPPPVHINERGHPVQE